MSTGISTEVLAATFADESAEKAHIDRLFRIPYENRYARQLRGFLGDAREAVRARRWAQEELASAEKIIGVRGGDAEITEVWTDIRDYLRFVLIEHDACLNEGAKSSVA